MVSFTLNLRVTPLSWGRGQAGDTEPCGSSMLLEKCDARSSCVSWTTGGRLGPVLSGQLMGSADVPLSPFSIRCQVTREMLLSGNTINNQLLSPPTEIVPRDLRMKDKFLKHLTGRVPPHPYPSCAGSWYPGASCPSLLPPQVLSTSAPSAANTSTGFTTTPETAPSRPVSDGRAARGWQQGVGVGAGFPDWPAS